MEKNLKVKDIRNIKKAVQREKLKQREPLPTSTEDFVAKFMNIKTSPSLCKKVWSNIIMIYNKELLGLLSQDFPVLADGTFQVAPRFFCQLYTFHIIKKWSLLSCRLFLFAR